MGEQDDEQGVEEEKHEKGSVELKGTGAGPPVQPIGGNKKSQGSEQQ